MSILESDVEKLRIQALLTQDLAERDRKLIDIALNAEYERLSWFEAMEMLNPRLKELKTWQLRKRIVKLRGRAIAINRLGSIAQISLASASADDELPLL